MTSYLIDKLEALKEDENKIKEQQRVLQEEIELKMEKKRKLELDGTIIKLRTQVDEIRNQGLFEGDPLENVNEGVIEYHPSYSPDGKKLAYITSQDRDYRIPFVVIYDFETGKKHVVKKYVDTRISWFPDSNRILFVRNKNGYNDLFVYDIAKSV